MLLVQLPDARHEVASVALHITVVAPPTSMLAGVAVTTTTGLTGAPTATVVEAEFDPPAPVQVNVYVVVVVGVTDSLPLIAGEPLQPPEAVQVLAFEALQESMAPLPATTDCSDEERVTSGFITGASVPAPEQPASKAERPHRLKSRRQAAGIPESQRRRIDPRF